MDKRTRIMAAVMCALALCGCSGGSYAGSGGTSFEDKNAAATSEAATGGSYAMWDSDSVADASYEEDAAAEPARVANAVSEDAGEGVEQPSMMIRRTANIELTSRDYDKATADLTALINEYSVVTLGDDVHNGTSYYGSRSYRSRSVRLRVKTERFDEFCDGVSSSPSWKVATLNKSADDVTKQYNDTEQRIDALQTRYEWYKEQVATVSEPELAREYSEAMFDTLDEITMLQNRNNDLKTDVDYSVVSISLAEDTTLDDMGANGGVWEEIGDQLKVLPSNIAETFGMFVLFLIEATPAIIILLIIAAIILLIRKAHKSYRAKHPKKQRVPRHMATPAMMPMAPQQPAAPQQNMAQQPMVQQPVTSPEQQQHGSLAATAEGKPVGEGDDEEEQAE